MIKLRPNKSISGVYYTRIKVLQFKPQVDLVSDEDIMDLFMGLVRLIKRNAELEVEERYLDKIKSMTRKIESLSRAGNIKQ
ncbi:MAG: hypothetical protein E7356_04795 [Clostridiales bacterium]|jgi:hypothetical protein|nr:hypothetical protein [Clostridiales bacterium]